MTPGEDVRPASADVSAHRAALGLAAAILMTALAAFATLRLTEQLRFKSDRAALVLSEVNGSVHAQDAIEWKVIGTQHLSEELVSALRDVREEARAGMEELRSVAPEAHSQLRSLLGRYERAVDQELALLEAGDLAAARALDESEVDPAHEQLVSVSESLVDEYQRRASRYRVRLELVQTLVVFSAAGLLELSLWRYVTHRKRAEKSLLAARDQAMETSRLKSEFLAMMSHEIRTPLNAVIGLTGLLVDTPLTAQQRQYADEARKAGEALLSVINDILDFSKIEAGRLDLERIPFEPRRILDDAADLVSATARTKGLTVASFTFPDVPVTVVGDPGRLRQILLNLLGNAVKFTEQGRIVARARLEARDGEAVALRFEVADTGVGISEEARAHLFESFRQADASASRRYGGTGLGLAISRRLVEMMDGRIGVDSRPGRGSTFWFTASFVRSGEIEEHKPAAPPFEGQRVLIVDDDETSRVILERQLAAWGLETRAAGGGLEALDLLAAAAGRGESYGLLILDMDMPDLDGAQLAAAVRSDVALPHVPVILLSSSDAPAAVPGVDLVLRKPVRQSQLHDALVELSAGRREARRDEAKPRLGRTGAGSSSLRTTRPTSS